MIVSEAYIRFQVNLAHSEKREIGTAILRIAELGAEEFFAGYGTERIGEAVIEDGSSKLRARIRTSAIAIVSFVGAYGTLRSGIDHMWYDGREAAGWMADRMEPSLPGPPEARRRRAPAASRLRKLFERVEAGELSAADASEMAKEILREYRESPETVAVVVEQLTQEFVSIEQAKPIRKRRMPAVTDVRRPTAIRAGKRLSVFRDPRTGAIRYVEE